MQAAVCPGSARADWASWRRPDRRSAWITGTVQPWTTLAGSIDLPTPGRGGILACVALHGPRAPGRVRRGRRRPGGGAGVAGHGESVCRAALRRASRGGVGGGRRDVGADGGDVRRDHARNPPFRGRGRAWRHAGAEVLHALPRGCGDRAFRARVSRDRDGRRLVRAPVVSGWTPPSGCPDVRAPRVRWLGARSPGHRGGLSDSSLRGPMR